MGYIKVLINTNITGKWVRQSTHHYRCGPFFGIDDSIFSLYAGLLGALKFCVFFVGAARFFYGVFGAVFIHLAGKGSRQVDVVLLTEAYDKE